MHGDLSPFTLSADAPKPTSARNEGMQYRGVDIFLNVGFRHVDAVCGGWRMMKSMKHSATQVLSAS